MALKKRMIDLREKIDQLEVVAGRTLFVYGSSVSGFEEFNRTHEAYLTPGLGTSKSAQKVFTDLQSALDAVGPYGQILLAPGGYTGNFTTPVNAVAPFVKLKALNRGDNDEPNLSTYLAPTSQSSPILEVKARGWEICGFEIDNPTGAAVLLRLAIMTVAAGSPATSNAVLAWDTSVPAGGQWVWTGGIPLVGRYFYSRGSALGMSIFTEYQDLTPA